MSIAHVDWIPIVVLLVILVAAVVACFVLLSSLRVYRRKRNWIIYGVIALLLGLTAFEAYDAFIGPAVVTYSFDAEENQFRAGVNQFDVTCTSLSDRQTSFNLILCATNASLISISQDCIQLNSTALKIPFTLQGLQQTQTKPVQFSVDQNVTDFSFSLSMDRQEGSPATTGGILGAECTFNNATNGYTIKPIYGPYA